jgi:hypothetical protein
MLTPSWQLPHCRSIDVAKIWQPLYVFQPIRVHQKPLFCNDKLLLPGTIHGAASLLKSWQEKLPFFACTLRFGIFVRWQKQQP